MILHEKISAQLPDWRDRIKVLAKEHGEVKVDDVTVGQVIGGMRDIKSLLTDVSFVDPAHGIKSLLEKRMIRILGRKKVVGNPLLYGTTKQFLVHFGLDRLADLPSLEDFDQFLGTLEGGAGGFLPPTEELVMVDDPEAASEEE